MVAYWGVTEVYTYIWFKNSVSGAKINYVSEK